MYRVICDDPAPAGREILGWGATDTYPDELAARRTAAARRRERPRATVTVCRRVDTSPAGDWHLWEPVEVLPPADPMTVEKTL